MLRAGPSIGPRFPNEDGSRLPSTTPRPVSPGSYSAYLQLGRARPWAQERLKGMMCDARG